MTGKSPQELQTDRQTGEICWQEYAPEVSPELVQILNQAIKLQAGERFTTASKMLYALNYGGTIPPVTIPIKPQPVTQKTVALSPPNALRSNQQIKQEFPSDSKTDVVGVSSLNSTPEVWQKLPVIIGSLVLGSLIGGIAISSFAISTFRRQSQRQEKLANSNVVAPTVTPSSVSPLDKDSQANSLPSPSPTPEADNNSTTSSSSAVDNSSVSRAPVATETEVPQEETQGFPENTQLPTQNPTDQEEENIQSTTSNPTNQEENNTQSTTSNPKDEEENNTQPTTPTPTNREEENTQSPVTIKLPQEEKLSETSPEEKPEQPESSAPKAQKPSTDNNDLSVPAFPVGTTKDTIKAALGEPNKDSRGIHGDTRAHLYRQPKNLDIDLGLIIDRNSGVLRQTEVTFRKDAGKDVMERRLQGMLGGNIPSNIKKKLEKVYQRQERKQYFQTNGLEGVIQRNEKDRIYIGVWDSNLH